MALALSSLELATLLPGAERFVEQNATETWKATLQAESGQTIAYLKLLPPNQLLSEAVCALLGRALGLNIPRPFLVLVHRPQLPDSPSWQRAQHLDVQYGFALEDGRHPSLRRWLNDHWAHQDHAKVTQLLRSWSGLREAAVFDEWIANGDRNIGNLLYDGNDNWILIDHSHALTGPGWVPSTLAAGAEAHNKLIAAVADSLSQIERYHWRAASNQEAKRYRDVELAGLGGSCFSSSYSPAAHMDAVSAFLRDRIEKVVGLVCKRLGIGELLP